MRRLLVLLAIVSLAVAAEAGVERFDVPILDSPSRGPADAPVTIIEFLDFQ